MAKKGKLTFGNTQGNVSRPVKLRKYKQLFLIVCEDQTTEPAYFRQFKEFIPDDTLYLREVGTGLSPKGVVERAVLEAQKLANEAGKDVDMVWAVFDRDDAGMNATTVRNFNNAYTLAAASHINIALSNEVFELWLLLHLRYIDPAVALGRAEIYEMLQSEIRLKLDDPGYVYDHYHGAAAIVPLIAQYGSESAAIERAAQLADFHAGVPPIDANPSTDVYALVEVLLQSIAFYSYQG